MIVLKAYDLKGNEYPKMKYIFYSMREAKKSYREVHGLKGRHNVIFITV